jgi:ATP-binding cassette subfamily B protein
VTFDVQRGEIVSVWEERATGLAALAGVLRGEIKPDEGAILFEEAAVSELGPDRRPELMAVVDGRAALSPGTVEENIAAGRPGVSISAVLAAARAAGVTEFLRYMPQGLASQVDDPRALLSRGQTRRILLARALCAESPVLVLWNVLAGIDEDSWRFIWEAVENGKELRATLILTTDEELGRRADRAFSLRQGRLTAL